MRFEQDAEHAYKLEAARMEQELESVLSRHQQLISQQESEARNRDRVLCRRALEVQARLCAVFSTRQRV